MTHIEQMIQDLCPNGVEWKTLREVCGVQRGKRLTKSELSDSEKYPVYHGGIEPLGFYKEYNREAETVMVINVGASAGTIGYSKEPFWSSDGCFCIGHSDIVIARFLYYYLQTREKEIKSRVRYAGIPTLDGFVVEQFPIPLPPIEIQKKIVECLDKFSALAAELQAELQKRRTQYEYYRTRLLTPPQTISPEGSTDERNWEWKTLGDVCEMKAGIHINATDIRDAKDSEYLYPCFGGNGIRGYVKSYSHIGEYPIIGRQGALCGCVNYAQDKFYATEHAVVVKPNKGYSSRYLFHMLTLADLNQYKSQGAQPGLAVGNLKTLRYAFPPLKEQKRIADLLDKFEALTTSLSDGIPAEQAAQQKRYEYYRDRLLTFPKAEK